MPRVGVVDIVAVVVVAVVFLLPERQFLVSEPYPKAPPGAVDSAGLAQAQLIAEPGNGEVASRLADTLRRLGEYQDALRMAGDALGHGGGWRAALAVSAVHADRVEVQPAFDYADRAMKDCDSHPDDCPAYEHVRLELYRDSLKAGLASGVDPRRHPEQFREQIIKAVRVRSN